MTDLVQMAGAPMVRARAAAMPTAVRIAHYRPDIDGLRAVAVVGVIIYHAFPGILPGGLFGVDIFFVISGYLITQLILKEMHEQRFSVAEFYRRRVRRILPALVVVLAASALFGWFALLPWELTWLGSAIAWSAPFMANVFFARAGDYGNYFAPGAELSPLIHLWSLAVEEQFYLAWPLLLLLAGRARVTLRILSTVIAISLALSVLGNWLRPGQSFYLPTSRAWELAGGGLLAAAHASAALALPLRFGRYRIGMPAIISVAGLVLILLGIRFVTTAPALSGLLGLIPAAGATALIAAGSQAPVNRYLLASRPMVFVGRISYPLYLWHWPALSFTRIVIGRSLTYAEAAAAVLFAAVAAYATCRLVEEPIRFGHMRRRAVPALLWTLAAMAVLGVGLEGGWVGGRLSNGGVTAWRAAAVNWAFPGAKKDDLWMLTTRSRRGKVAVFIGDSHVQQYWERVRLIIERHPQSARSAEFATYTGCPPLPDLDGLHRGSHCSSAFPKAIAMAFHTDVDTVVFGAFWEAYLMGEFTGGQPLRLTLPVYSHGDPLRRPLTLDSPGTQRALEDFGHIISRLTASGRRVFIILSNPTSPRFDPGYMFPSRVRLSLHLPERITAAASMRSVDERQWESYVAPLMARLRLIAVKSGAIIIDPSEVLCPEMTCPAADVRGLPVHLDSNHLTQSFVREHATFIDAILLAPDASRRAP